MYVYTIQPVVKPVVQPVWQPVVSCRRGITKTLALLSNRVVQPVWQTCWTNSHCSFNRLSNRVVQPAWEPVWQPAVYTIQPVVKPVWQPVSQPAVSCIQTFNRLSSRFYNRFHNRLYRVNRALRLCSKPWRPIRVSKHWPLFWASRVCNGYSSCRDWSDEQKCSIVTVIITFLLM